MATPTPNLGLLMPARGEPGWDVMLNANTLRLDGAATLGAFAVRAASVDPATGAALDRAYTIGAGTWIKPDGSILAVPARTGHTAPAGATTYVWHDGSGDPGTGTSFPTTGVYLPLAAITADPARITSIVDRRWPTPFLRQPTTPYRSANYASTSQAFDKGYSAYYFAPTADVTLTLPSSMAGLDGLVLTVVKIDASGHSVTIDGNGKPISGASTVALSAQWQRVTLIASEFVGVDGWVAIG